jgi:glucose/mannose-6-phosphate isomerase
LQKSRTLSPSEGQEIRARLRAFPLVLLEAARRGASECAQWFATPPSKMAYFGVGGSGIAAALLRPLLPEDSPVRLLNGLRLSPGELKECDFFVFISYSGNSEEVVSAYSRLKPRRSQAVCISSGGTLIAEARSRGTPRILLPPGHLPRFALPDLLGSVYALLEAFGMVPPEYLATACQALERVLPRIEESARSLADQASSSGYDRFIVAAFSGYEALARRWAGQICENAKTEAEAVVLPESFHNLIVPLCEGVGDNPPAVFILRDPEAPQADLEARWTRAFQRTLREFGNDRCLVIKPPRIRSRGARILALSLLGDFFSVELAERKSVSILQTRSIDHYKSLLRAGGQIGCRP